MTTVQLLRDGSVGVAVRKPFRRLSKEEMAQHKEEKNREIARIQKEHPFRTWGLPPTHVLKYEKAIIEFPDLEALPNAKMILAAYDFRKAQIDHYRCNHTTELADARCDIQIGGFKDTVIPADLPALAFEKECIVCHEFKKEVSLCPECWQKIRRCLELKANKGREGWTHWGYEWFLDTRPLIELIHNQPIPKQDAVKP